MKRILLVCFLLTAGLTLSSVQRASAQVVVTAASFTAQVNQMDSYIAAGNMTMAQTTFDTLNRMMKNVLAVSKHSISSAATPADKASFMTILNNQRTLYNTIWGLKTDLAANRAALHAKLGEFDLTIN